MNRLTALGIKNLKPQPKAKLHSDGGGLYLLLKPNGSKLWQFTGSLHGKKIHTYYGSHPAVALAEAREWREKQARLLREGVDPRERKKEIAEEARKKVATFKVVAEEWF